MYQGQDLVLGDIKDVGALIKYFYERSLGELLDLGDLTIKDQRYKNPFKVEVPSNLVRTLINSCNDCNWVDIENEFYNELKYILKRHLGDKGVALKEVNNSLKCIINLLEQYLLQLPEPSRLPGFDDLFIGPIRKRDVYGDEIKTDEDPKDILILNFNYTNTMGLYHTQYGDSDERDHQIPGQADHQFRGKLTRGFRYKLTTLNV